MSAEAPAPPNGPQAWPMYRAVVGVGLLCGLAIVMAHESTLSRIARMQLEMREQAIKDVLPGARSSQAFRLTEDNRFEPVASNLEESNLVFAGYDENLQLVGLALEARGMGYQDVVRLLYGYSLERQAILGFRVLESRETPGLGDRIETDPGFLANFGKLDVSLQSDGAELAHPIEFVKPGKKTADWQIDGISGATITSKATADMLGESAARWAPLLQARRSDFLNPQPKE